MSPTSFFRDPQAWTALASGPLPELLKSRPDSYSIRAWVPGCATGEEVFTLAIVMRECMQELKRHFDVQIFGSDLDSQAVDAARVGQYPSGIGVDVSPERLERYFTSDDNVYRIRKEVREMAIFASQDVIKDPPFTKLDVISCRNLMIYLNADLQHRLLPIFHYALKPGGLLILDPSETIGRFSDLFDPVDRKWKIFRRKETPTAVRELPEMPASQLPVDAKPSDQQLKDAEQRWERLADAIVDYMFTVRIQNGETVETIHGPNCDAITGYTPAEFAADENLWITIVPPEDRPLVDHHIRQTLRQVSGTTRFDRVLVRTTRNAGARSVEQGQLRTGHG